MSSSSSIAETFAEGAIRERLAAATDPAERTRLLKLLSQWGAVSEPFVETARPEAIALRESLAVELGLEPGTVLFDLVTRWDECAVWLETYGDPDAPDYEARCQALERMTREIGVYSVSGFVLCSGCECRTTPGVKAKWKRGRCDACQETPNA